MKDLLRDLSPYLLTELLLPGGTVIALALWLYRRKFGRKLTGDGPVQIQQRVAQAPRH